MKIYSYHFCFIYCLILHRKYYTCGCVKFVTLFIYTKSMANVWRRVILKIPYKWRLWLLICSAHIKVNELLNLDFCFQLNTLFYIT